MQNQHSVWRILLLATLITLALSGLVPARFSTAQATNLLQNPGFEGTYVPFEGDTSRLVAPGWSPWNVAHKNSDPGFLNLVPEYRPAANPKRIRSGSNAQEFFTFFATHTAGVLQRVPVAPGSKLQFSVFVNVWSTGRDDPDASEEPGGVRVSAGIDPLGGTDGASPNIVWNEAPELYDQYQQITVEATAAGSFVTVFVQSAPKDPVKNNNSYVDDASLVVTGTGVVPTTVAPTQTQGATAIGQVPTDTPNPIGPTREGTIAGPTNTPGPIVLLPTDTPFQFSTPTPKPLQPTVGPTVAPPGTILYTVVAGDTLSGLATRYNTTVDAITSANGLNADGLIFIGQKLVIPVPATATPLVPPTATPQFGTGGSKPPVDTANLNGPTVNGIGTYIVQPGDDLQHIAQHYGMTVEALAQLNGIVNPNLIPLGTVLVVPGPGNNVPGGSVPPTVIPTVPGTAVPATPKTHTVAAGENLFRISLKYNVTLDALMRANGITNPNLVYVGQVLRIP